MKAWQFTGTDKALGFNEVAEPKAGPGQVVVEVKAAGVCHSDVTALDDPGWMPLFRVLPRTMGHENAGVIVEVGEGMDQWKVGDRVGLAPVMADGDAKPGMKVGVIGLGSLGYIGARVAALSGAEVYGAEINPETRKLADEIGLAGVAEFGTLVQVGMGRLEATINTYPIIINQLRIKGSKSGTREDLEALYALMKSGELNPPMNLITQAEIPGTIDKLRAGGVVVRYIATISRLD